MYRIKNTNIHCDLAFVFSGKGYKWRSGPAAIVRNYCFPLQQ